MAFEFVTANRIIFGNGKLASLGAIAAELGTRALVVTGSNIERARPLLHLLEAAGLAVHTLAVPKEPTIQNARDGAELVSVHGVDVVFGFGGGSAIDAGKAIAALATNGGDPLDYLEVIGKGQPLTVDPLPYIAIPTTAGTGAEVAKNAVLKSEEHNVKVSLRHPKMLPDIALVDPELTHSVPPHVTAFTGMDALTQVLEPYVSHLANPLTDGLSREGITRAAGSLREVYTDGSNAQAREDMALASLIGGLVLTNARLGAVHGFAGPLGGMYDAPHGAICAALLPHVMQANVEVLKAREPDHFAIPRFDELGQMLTGDKNATAADGVAWVQETAHMLDIQPLSAYGVKRDDFPQILEKSGRSSSMKGNPIKLTDDELTRILEMAL
ncbi:MAG: iron-containing alcohol dehydrogenase [Chloroflexota bacterium]